MRKPMKLKIESCKGGYQLMLDDTEIHHIETYQVKSSALSSRAELTITMLVEFPIKQENIS